MLLMLPTLPLLVLVSFMHTYISVTLDNDQNRLNSNYVNSTCQVAMLCINKIEESNLRERWLVDFRVQLHLEYRQVS